MDLISCTKCNKTWSSREEFLLSPEIKLLGYQANFTDAKVGWFLFNHNSFNCRTTLAVEVGKFIDLYHGPHYAVNLNRSDECSHYCLDTYNFEQCHAHCSMAYIRKIALILKDRELFRQIVEKMHFSRPVIKR